MNLSEVFTSQAIAQNYTNALSNTIPYLGVGLFPQQKKAGLDLKWIKGHNGLAVSLMPSVFDAKSTLRDRVGISIDQTEMAFFRESMLLKEADAQEILRVQGENDPYAAEVLDNVFNDTKTLIDGADVVSERMRMQLLAPLGGNVGIQIKANNVDYTYNYDPDGSWKAAHYTKITGDTAVWSADQTCDPIKNLEDALDKEESESGSRPEIIIMNKKTFNYIKNCKKVRENIAVSSSLISAGIQGDMHYTTARVQQYLEAELGVSIIIYNKQYKDESGMAKKFFPDDIVAMLPSGAVGKTWYGTTPEESRGEDVAIVNMGVAVQVSTSNDPVNTKTTVSEIVLPSFERMNEFAALEVC